MASNASSPHKQSKAGTVYVLTNASLKSMVKIGFTTRTAAVRAKELSGTSLPTAFEVAYESTVVDDARAVERIVHNELIGSRIQNGREFFKVTAAEAEASIKAAVAAFQQAPTTTAATSPQTVTITVPPGVTEIMLRLETLSVAAGDAN